MFHICSVTDLNAEIGKAAGFCLRRRAHVFGSVGVRPVDGSPAVADVSPHRRALRWRPACARFQLCESVPLHGVRAARLSREPARHRNVPACPEREALPLGYSRLGGQEHAGRRERSAGLAHLRRVRAAPHSHRASALPERTLRRGPEGDRLRPGLDHNRPVLGAVPVGTVSFHQGRDQAAHVDRSAREHPELHPHLRRETARRQHPGRTAARGRLPST